jgi:cell division transport system permease protein
VAFRPVHVVRRALQAMVRGPYVTLTGTGTILVAVLVTGLFAAALGGLERLVTAWAGQVRLSVYLAPGADLEQARAAAAALAPGLAVEAVPAAEGLRRLSASLGGQAGVLEGVGPEALPDAVEVAAPGQGLAETRALAARLKAIPGAAEVDFGDDWLARLEAFVARARTAGLALLGLLALGTAVLVSNTLRLAVFARREEIEIMKLVGATDAFVGAPFLVEGLLQGLLGGGLAALALLALHAAVAPRLAALSGLAAPLARADLLPGALLLWLVLGGGAVGLFASGLALARHLRRA